MTYQAHRQPHAHRESKRRLVAETLAFLFVCAVVVAVLSLEAVA